MKDSEYNNRIEELKNTTDLVRKSVLQNQLRQERFRRKRTISEHEITKQNLKDYRLKKKNEIIQLKKEKHNINVNASNTIKKHLKKKLQENKIVDDVKKTIASQIITANVKRKLQEKKQIPIENTIETPIKEPKKVLIVKPPKKNIGRPKNNTILVPIHKKYPDMELEDITIAKYIRMLDSIHYMMTNKQLGEKTKLQLNNIFRKITPNYPVVIEIDMKYLKNDIENVIIKLRAKYDNDNTFKTYISTLMALTSRIKAFKNIYETLYPINAKLKKDYEVDRDNNDIDEKDAGKIISYNNEDIMTNLDKINNLYDRVVYAIHMLVIPRRLENRFLKITYETDIDKLTDKNNYIIIDNNEPIKLVYNNYKTKKTYNQQTVDIPPLLKKILKDYIIDYDIKESHYLFGLKKDKKLLEAQSSYSNRIKRVFKKIYNEDISNKWLRVSYSTHMNKQILSNNDKKDLSEALGHSLTTNQQYNKLFIKGIIDKIL